MTFKQMKNWLGWNVGFIFKRWRILVKFNPSQYGNFVYSNVVIKHAVLQWLRENAHGRYKILKVWVTNNDDYFLIQFRDHKIAMLFKLKWVGR